MTTTVRHILLDIEGTTCPVSFVSEVLFPYAASKVAFFLNNWAEDNAVRQLVEALMQAWQQEDDPEAQALYVENLQSDAEAKQKASQPILAYIDWLTRRDRKVTAWKDLQGRIWKEGYACGELKAELFPETADTLRTWKRQGIDLSVYSSGSVAAQQLLYGHSSNGDLRGLFSHWFDTHIGLKQQAESYRRILQVIAVEPPQVLFISDAAAELRAADQAGLQVVFSQRPGNPEQDAGGFPRITSLKQLALATMKT